MSKKPSKAPSLSPQLPTGIPNIDDLIEFEELKNGMVRLDDNITQYEVTEALQKINYCIAIGVKTIRVFITSPGGGVYESFSFYDNITGIQNENKHVRIIGMVSGYAASAASMIILQSFKERWASGNSRLLLHEPRRFTMFNVEKTTEMKESTEEMSKVSEMIYSILSKRTKKSVAVIKKLIERKEVWMSANEAKKFGLIDKII